jgi:8-oxo-dGTP pyrophosphatase MutT (NUDIX family)
MAVPEDGVAAALDAFEPRAGDEAEDVARIRALVGDGDPWSRSSPVHVTGSAIIVHPDTGLVLLRWHDRMQGWLQMGGHGDPGEVDPFAVALREAREETGLPDLAAWPDPGRPVPVHVVMVPVPAGRGEPDHEHADIRYVLATGRPDEATPESPAAPLRWLAIDDAMASSGVAGEDNLRTTLIRVAELLAGRGGGGVRAWIG